jgi:hypothetical protein
VDGLDQAEYAGAFLWATHADARLTVEEESADGFDVRGSHDGYLRLADPVGHERRVSYRRGLGYRVRDRLSARRTHRYALVWNFGPRVRLDRRTEAGGLETWEASLGEEPVLRVVLRCSTSAAVRLRRGDESGPAGFASPRYLEWHPVPSLWVEIEAGACELETFLLTHARAADESRRAVEEWR